MFSVLVRVAVGVEAFVHVVVQRISTGPVRNGARPLQLHVVQHQRGVDKLVRLRP